MNPYGEGFHVFGQGKYENSTFDEVIQRMYTAAGVQSQVELANWLGVKQSWISDAKRRGRMPILWLRELIFKTNYNPYWVMTGQGEPEFGMLVLDNDVPAMDLRPIVGKY